VSSPHRRDRVPRRAVEGAGDARHVFRIASMTKSFTAMRS
jgi:CubicO group peptidase (beta-lactamase class C family)